MAAIHGGPAAFGLLAGTRFPRKFSHDSSPSPRRMPLSLANHRVLNPTTGISYRLMADSTSWRITSSAPVGSVVS